MSARVRPVLLLNGAQAGVWHVVDGTYFTVPLPITIEPVDFTLMRAMVEGRAGVYDIPLPAFDTYRALKLTLFNRVLWVAVLSGTREDELPQLAIRALFKDEVVDRLNRAL